MGSGYRVMRRTESPYYLPSIRNEAFNYKILNVDPKFHALNCTLQLNDIPY
jgi:hypothetical protein